MTTWDASPIEDTIVASASSPRGEVVLRRRGRDDELELRVNGVFVMDSAETSTERAIARVALSGLAAAQAPSTGWHILVGGLGLGYTLAELLTGVRTHLVTVAEIEPALVGWHRTGLIPETAQQINSSRVQLRVDDVREVMREQESQSLDAIILDVDNGPGYLVYEQNATVYQPDFLRECRDALTDKGILVVWSADDSPELESALRQIFQVVQHDELPVALGRVDRYHAYAASGLAREGADR